MGSIGGLSSSTSSSLTGIRGYGGLASGLDRDTLIEGMTSGTTNKIQQQYQKKQKLQWQQTAIQGISTKLVEFSRKYASYTSSTNLSGSNFFARSMISVLGANSGKISVSGSSSIADSVSITGVKQLARNTSMSSINPVSDQTLTTGALDTTTVEAVSNLENESLIFKYGNKTVGLFLPSGTVDGFTYDYSDIDKAITSINKAMEGTAVASGKKLSDVMEAFKDGDKLSFRVKADAETDGNAIKLTSGTEKALGALGLSLPADGKGKPINENGIVIDNPQNLWTDKKLHERLSEKKITFNYNGTAKSISFMQMDENTTLEQVRADLQTKLDKEFGIGRIKVSLDGANAGNTEGSLKFETMNPTTGNKDSSSVLTMTSSDVGVLGKTGALKIDYGASNRLNTSSTLLDSGLVRLPAGKGPDDPLELKINGVEIENLTYNSSVSDIISAINSADTGVKVSYMQNADKFTIEATDAGASGQIKLEGADAAVLFGAENTDYTITKGQDAIVTIKYAGSDEEINLIRGSNSFNLDGLNITVRDKFGWEARVDAAGNPVMDADGNPVYDKVDTEAVTFSAKVDNEKITTAVTDMIKDYNEMLELINKEVGEKPNRKFPPLTDKQKEDLSEKEIEKWEEEAKKGTLFNDVDVRGLADGMRFIFPSGSEERKQMESYGITVSTDYSDNGKLVLDEEKFKAALESDPEGVKELFTRPASEVDEDDKGGLMARIKTLTDRYASTTGSTKGILIERAGSLYAPTTILNNRIQKEMDTIDNAVTRLQKKLEVETDRYIRQFTTLETLISQMNSQSSWLAQVGGGAM